MSLIDNKNTVRRFLDEMFNKGRYTTADELLSVDFVDHSPLQGLPPNRDGFKQSFVIFRNVFPDMLYAIEDIVAEGDMVVVRWSATGTQKGELMGLPPTGKHIAITGIDIFRLANGKLVEMWLSWDQLGMLQQLGAIPKPG
jgi:steroid delta-isomerase-like uncharacterized protein